MDANTVTTVAQQLTPFQLLEKVDLFYNGAWEKLVIYVTILIAFTGVLVPILVTWLQKRLFALEEDKIKAGLKEYCGKLTQEIKQDIASKFNEQKEAVDKKSAELEKKLSKKIAESRGATLHIQGNFYLKQNIFLTALESYIDAIPYLIEANDQLNLIRVLKATIDICMPKIYAEDLESLEHDRYDLDIIIQSLEHNNIDSRYTDQIINFKKAIHSAKQRKRIPGK